MSTQITSDVGNSILQIRKSGKHVDIVFAPYDSSGEVFVGTEASRVRWRIDSGQLHIEDWHGSQDGTALFSSQPYVLLQALEHPGKGHTLKVEYEPYEYAARLVDFDLPSTVPPPFSKIADPIVAADERIAAIRSQYKSCMSDDSQKFADCKKILTDHGYSYPPNW